jgi:hypothetical protein
MFKGLNLTSFGIYHCKNKMLSKLQLRKNRFEMYLSQKNDTIGHSTYKGPESESIYLITMCHMLMT